MDHGTVLIRHSAPSELDQNPYGTQCKVMHHEAYDIYLQVGYDEEHPVWELLGDFTEKTDPEHLQELINARLKKHSNSD